MKIVTVSQLTGYIKEKLESDMVLNNLWVRGEISNFKHHSSGHMYLTLKDKTSSLRAVMFRSRNQSLQFMPADGMAVIARGSVTVYERDGQYQLYIAELQPDGVGTLYTAYLQLKERLEKEGLFDQARKRPLPVIPRRVGVITSPTGAAVRDIINVITRRYPQAHLLLIPVAVQGEGAPEQVARGIQLANLVEGIDVIIVGRGGGSIEELWAFNTEVVARSIFNSRIPVVSAVGHETDFTIADFVADKRAATPSAAAEIVVPDYRELGKHLENLTKRLVTGVRNRTASLRERTSRFSGSQALRRPKDSLYRKMQDIDYITRRLGQAIQSRVNSSKNGLALQVSRLHDLSPLATMSRGYTVCRDSKGTVVKGIAQVRPGDSVELIMTDGKVDCIVETVKEGVYGQEKS